MARRGRFGSAWVYPFGLLVIASAAFTGLWLWQQKAARLIQARTVLAAEVAQGPPVQVTTIVAGPNERLITLLAEIGQPPPDKDYGNSRQNRSSGPATAMR